MKLNRANMRCSTKRSDRNEGQEPIPRLNERELLVLVIVETD